MVEQLFQTVLKTLGLTATVFALLLSFAALFLLPNEGVMPARWALVFGTIALWTVVIFAVTLRDVLQSYQVSVKVVAGHTISTAFSEAGAMILVKSSWFLNHTSIVSVYETQDVLERLIAIGQVINIQADGHVQIALTDVSDNKGRMEAISQNRADVLKNLLVKPTIPQRFVDLNR